MKLLAHKLSNHQGFIRYFKNTSWMMGERILYIIANFFVGLWVARYLGPEQFGLLSYVLAYAAIIGGITKLGLDGVIVRELINAPEKRQLYLGTAFWLKALGALITVVIISYILPFTSNDPQTNTLIIIVVFGLIFQSFEVIEFYFQSQVLAKIVSICKVVQLALSSLIKIYFVIIEADLIWFVLLTAFDMLSLGVSYILAYKLQKLPAFFKFFRFSIAKELLQDSWPFMLSIVVFSIYQQMDIIMIKELLGIYEVGLYSAGLKIGLAHVFLSTVITMSLFPAILNSKNNCNKLYHQRIESLFSLLIFINFVVAVSIVLFGEWLIRVLLGIEYLSAYQVLIIQTWSSIFAALGFAFQQVLLAENLGKAALYRALSGLSINFILNLMLIPIYGIIGAAISLLIAQAFANYFYDVFFKKMRVYFYIKSRSFLFYRFFKATLKI